MALIALGVTGGIGAYKAVEVCRGLQQAGHEVVAVMTRSATRFVGAVTFEAITRRPVITSQWKAGMNSDIEHIAIADAIDLLLVAPCTANVIGKFANGIADDFLSSLYLATKAPVLIAPAMNSNMLAHEAVQRNLQTLSSRGVAFVDPGEGYLACGWIGKGRLAEPAEVVDAALRTIGGAARPLDSARDRPLDSARDRPLDSARDRQDPPDGAWRGRRILVTAGPTIEDIDAVRFVGNRSSGRMGFALAAEASRRGATVTLIAGPSAIEPPAVDAIVRVRSAAEMHEAVMRAAASADAVIMAAAVADYAPAKADGKIAKADGPLTLTLTRTRDILADLGSMRTGMGSRRPLLIGFAAETDGLVEKARAKRAAKQVDLIVANDVSKSDRGFDATSNEVTLVGPEGEETIPLQGKDRIAAAILDRVEALFHAWQKTS
jgi:phosphopantothenoylcysteine decarboxylase/phosphopantothenate--cysteine ligase